MFKSFYQNYRRSRNYYLHKYMTFLLEEEEKATEQDQESLNDDRNSIDKYNDDVSRQESEMDALNMDEEQQEEVDTDSDSQTASADEMNENSNGKSKDKLTAMVQGKGEEDLDKETYEKHKRLTRKRACKRGLDPELINELVDESMEAKRPRRSLAEVRKSLTQMNEKSVPLYKVDSKTGKIKHCKVTLGSDFEELKNESSKIYDAEYKNQDNKIKEIKKMVDQSTNMDINQHDASTQYEVVPDTADNLLDEMFLNSVKLQLKQMNGRQKMNFKSKIYHALMEVFDDVSDFPQSIDIVKQPNKTTASSSPSLFLNTTKGELRLMRELASLVQAAKSTPEIVNSQDKASSAAKSPVKTKTAPSPTQNTETVSNSPLSLGLEEDDDLDFNLTTENLYDDEDLRLPRSLDEIMVKTNDNREVTKDTSNVMGLPRHVLQKVVKVAGPSGSTIVAHNGDKKRIYRIYPKGINNSQENRFLVNKNPSSVGTFFVAPSKTPGAAQTTQSLNKSNSPAPTISVKNFANKSANVANAYPSCTATVSTSGQQNQSNQNNAAIIKKISAPALYKSVHPANRILNASTGLFQNSTSSPSPSPMSANQSPSNSGLKDNQNSTANGASGSQNKFNNSIRTVSSQQHSMLPPSSNAHAICTFQAKKPMQVRSHVNMQRRFSICGALGTEKPTYKSVSVASNQSNANKSSYMPALAPKIQISKPVSLNKSLSNTNSNTTKDSNNKPNEDTNSQSTATNSKPTEDPVKPAAAAAASDMEESSAKEPEEMPIVETAGTIAADSLDPLYVKQTPIKSEPLDD